MEAYFGDKITGNAHKRMKTSFLYNPWEQRAKRRDKDQKARNSCTVHLVKQGCIDECCVYEQQVNNIHQKFTKHPPPTPNTTTQQSICNMRTSLHQSKRCGNYMRYQPTALLHPFPNYDTFNGFQDVTKFSKNRKAQSLNNKISWARLASFFCFQACACSRLSRSVWCVYEWRVQSDSWAMLRCSWERGPRHATKWGGAQRLDSTT